MIDIDSVLKNLVERRGSDLHLKSGRPPLLRLDGDLLPSDHPALSSEDVKTIAKKLLGEYAWRRFEEEWDCDSGYGLAGVGRFRINAFRQQGELSVVIRAIPPDPPTIEQLGLPDVLKEIVGARQGLVVVTGPTGSGKSTTLAAMIEHLNLTQPLHIVTIEDPVEFVYADKKCTINQRQLGTDVKTVHDALRRALRQDPDCILVGEMRDRETIELAIHAAETGHLVFSTLHTNDAKQTLDRIVDTYPADAQGQIRAMMALTLHAVVSQRLVRRADGKGRTVAMEILINSPAIRELIAAGKTRDIDKAIASSAFYKMQTFNQHLAQLVKAGAITEEEAMANSSAPGDLKLIIKGIGSGTTQPDTQTLKKEAVVGAAVDAAAKPPTSRFQIKRDF
jgi:twitching motility protein PilT